MHIGGVRIRALILLFNLFVEGGYPQRWTLTERLELLVVLISCLLFFLYHPALTLSIPLRIRGLHEPVPNPRYQTVVLPLLIATVTFTFLGALNKSQLDRMIGALPTCAS